MNAFTKCLLGAMLALVPCLGDASLCLADEPFYQGRVVKVIVPSGPGSSYDSYSRVLTQFLPAHIPGHPTFIIQTMNGAAGLVSAHYMYNVAPRDGTVIASGTSTIPTLPIVHPELTRMDVNRFEWIGNMARDAYVAYVWNSTPFRTYEDFKSMEAVLGGLTPSSPSSNLATLSNVMFGTKIKLVSGYEDQVAVQLAIERGELQGSFGGAYSALKVAKPEWLSEHKIRFILQHGLERLPDLPDTPLLIDQAKTAEDRQALELALAPQEFSKPFYMPPGAPADRVAILRRGFDDTIRDPAFLAAAAKANVPTMGATDGEELTRKIAQISAMPQAVADRIIAILAGDGASTR